MKCKENKVSAILTIVIIITFLCQTLIWALEITSKSNNLLNTNSAFDEDPRNREVIGEMTDAMEQRENSKLAIEAQVEQGWQDKRSEINQIKQKLDRLIAKIVARYSIVVIAPHNIEPKLPIDGDSFTFSATVFYRLVSEAERIGRRYIFIANPSEAKSDGNLYICLFPVSHDNDGYTKEDREMLNIPDLSGQRALFVGDVNFYQPQMYRRKDDFGFDAIVLLDHHKWKNELIDGISRDTDDALLLINNHLIFEGEDVDSYSCGAFCADLLKPEDDPWYHFVKQLSVFADKYYPFFPNLTKGLDKEQSLSVAEMLNLLGTYLMQWEPKEGDKLLERRKVMLQIIQIIAETMSFEELQKKLEAYSQQLFGNDFRTWYATIINEVETSIGNFLVSPENIYFYEVKSGVETTLLVHKIVFARLNTEDKFGQRIFVHYSVAEDGNVVVLLARGSKFHDIDVSDVCKNGPGGIQWGGGHKDRAGFGTKDVSDRLKDWWGETRDPMKILGYVKNILGIQYRRMSELELSSITSFINKNDSFLKDILGQEKDEILIRVPVEILKYVGKENVARFLGALQKAPNCYIELYTVSVEDGTEIEKIYDEYGLTKRMFPYDRTRSNTLTLFTSDGGINIEPLDVINLLMDSGIGYEKTVAIPIGKEQDLLGLIRGTIFGLRIVSIAGQDEDVDRQLAQETASLYNEVFGTNEISLDVDDIINLALGDINKLTRVLNKLIELLPIKRYSLEEIENIYRHTEKILIAA